MKLLTFVAKYPRSEPDGPEEPILFELPLQLLLRLFVGGQLKMLNPASYQPPHRTFLRSLTMHTHARALLPLRSGRSASAAKLQSP